MGSLREEPKEGRLIRQVARGTEQRAGGLSGCKRLSRRGRRRKASPAGKGQKQGEGKRGGHACLPVRPPSGERLREQRAGESQWQAAAAAASTKEEEAGEVTKQEPPEKGRLLRPSSWFEWKGLQQLACQPLTQPLDSLRPRSGSEAALHLQLSRRRWEGTGWRRGCRKRVQPCTWLHTSVPEGASVSALLCSPRAQGRLSASCARLCLV